jgi:hypothetical protein
MTAAVIDFMGARAALRLEDHTLIFEEAMAGPKHAAKHERSITLACDSNGRWWLTCEAVSVFEDDDDRPLM